MVTPPNPHEHDAFFAFFEHNRNTFSKKLYLDTKLIKNYHRFPLVALPEPEKITIPFWELITKRHSVRSFSSIAVSITNLSSLLYWSVANICSDEELPRKIRRPYPSGGAKYPIEIYLHHINKIPELASGVYYYEVDHHCLRHLTMLNERSHQILEATNRFNPDIKNASFYIILTYRKSKNYEKYGDFGYKLGLLEAGHIGQNICLTTTALNLAHCPIGTSAAAEITHLLDLNPALEHVVYTVAISSLNKT